VTKDANGVIVPGTKVSVEQNLFGIVRHSVAYSDHTGHFHITDIVEGVHDVSVSKGPTGTINDFMVTFSADVTVTFLGDSLQ
jgi:hypothetical protein